MEDTRNSLQLFAENTGGKAFLGGGNLVQSFYQAIQDDSSYYMLGYYVSPQNTKPGWHDISVSVHGRDARLRYRKGFFSRQGLVGELCTARDPAGIEFAAGLYRCATFSVLVRQRAGQTSGQD
jgi:hypothetical protein